MKITGNEDSVIYSDRSTVKLIGGGLTLNVSGMNNKIYVGKNVRFSGLTININSSNNSIYIEDDCTLAGVFIIKIKDGAEIHFGSGTTVGGANLICGEGRKIKFGKDCMIAWNIEIRTTDSHAIFDAHTNERINFGDDVIVGDHVWIGAHATILKGAKIPSGSVVALKSLVLDKFEENNVVIAGVPARVVKKNIRWTRELLG